jgi:signal transduction histidine kinase
VDSASASEHRLSLTMISIAEVAAPIFRLSDIGFTVAAYRLTLVLSAFLIVVAITNVLVLGFALKRSGPLTRGPLGVAFDIAQNFAVILGSAVCVPHGRYVSSTMSIPFGNYPAASIALLVNFPIQHAWFRRHRRMIAVAAVGFLVPTFYIGAALNGTPWSARLWGAMWAQELGNFAAIALGVVVWRFSREVGRQLVEQQALAYHRFIDFLHSDVKAGLSAIGLSLEASGISGPAIDTLEAVQRKIAEERLNLLLEETDTPLAMLLSERFRLYAGIFAFTEVPSVGSIILSAGTARMVDRVLGDLLSNVANAGQGKVGVRLHLRDGAVHLSVCDNGPGFSALVLDESGRSLNRLKTDLRSVQGDLRLELAQASWATVVTAIIPLDLEQGASWSPS